MIIVSILSLFARNKKQGRNPVFCLDIESGETTN